jgi:hypothetical protein
VTQSTPTLAARLTLDMALQRTKSHVDRGSKAAPLVLQVDTIDIERVSKVDLVLQHFDAMLLLGLCIKDGALDEDLARQDEIVKTHDDGSLHPSATWYLDHLDLPNAIAHSIDNATIVTRGDDLIMMLKITATFLEPMELENFPFDIQALTISVRAGCRVDGPFPISFVADGSERKFIQDHGIELITHEYQVGGELAISAGEIGTEGRCFPWLKISVMVKRRPGYALWNVMLPTGAVAMMASLQFLVPLTDMGTRLETSLTLSLTAAAYKLCISSATPDVSYLTLLDKYVLWCGAYITAMVFVSQQISISFEPLVLYARYTSCLVWTSLALRIQFSPCSAWRRNVRYWVSWLRTPTHSRLLRM